MGVAFYYSHSGYFAEVVQARVSRRRREGRQGVGRWRRRQARSSTRARRAESGARARRIDGISSALAQAITIANGRVVQTNFHDYPLLRMNQAPQVEVHFLMTRQPADRAGRAGVAAGGAGAGECDFRGLREARAEAADRCRRS